MINMAKEPVDLTKIKIPEHPLEMLQTPQDRADNLPVLIALYETILDTVEENLRIKGKRLEAANVEHATWLAYYDQRKIELSTITKFMLAQVESARGKLWKDYTKNMSLDLNYRDKENFINNEPYYLAMHELYLEIEELYKKFDAVVEAFKSRGYALNNITRIRIAEMSDYVL